MNSVTNESFQNLRDSSPLVSAVIVNFNGGETVFRCISSFLEIAHPPLEVIVVDNASTDGSIELIEDKFSSDERVKIIRNHENLGHAEGCNRGAEVARGKYLVFLDQDIEIDKRKHHNGYWLQEMLKIMENDKSVGITQAKIVLERANSLMDNVGLAVDAFGTWETPFGMKESKFDRNIEIFAASSGCSMVRKSVFDDAGGFDPDYFIYDEDTDLSHRVRLLGYKIIFVPTATAVHNGSPIRGISRKHLCNSVKNRACTMLKNYELRNLWWRLTSYLALTFLAAMIFILMKKVDEAKEILRGVTYPIRNFGKIWLKRTYIQSKRLVKDSELMRSGLLRSDILPTLRDIRLKLRHLR